jgi:hypothetical protein
MFEALLYTLLLVLAVNGSPLTSRDPLVVLSMSKQLNTSRISNIVKNDRARARQLLSKTLERRFSLAEVNEPVTNVAGVIYLASVGIGSPPTQCKAHAFAL